MSHPRAVEDRAGAAELERVEVMLQLGPALERAGVEIAALRPRRPRPRRLRPHPLDKSLRCPLADRRPQLRLRHPRRQRLAREPAV